MEIHDQHVPKIPPMFPTFMVSNGWHADDSTRPAQPPATKCINGFCDLAFFLLPLLAMIDGVEICDRE